ncbi:8-amino-7-oxononanoate synthase [Rhodococcus sp. 05-2256-B2]|uniref:8-amino-7-oxononanoate synthase n=1 Tax=unclassified Rhodococcus (in: high G+C Gram-positive bacteria) TaxID=192944 RepID=UPI000B9B7013|nr:MULTISPECIES: 8-amino-7-oxononanoate synthase [unclassified Rhodococcus (in: high G+C Gram-positive bacteria)]OZD78316.1 8-amino-7-oxononanoate synthase [Rhodococcus sp. 05-2256-B4]OZD90570.1 8-amino-7-oxononanoate synthase [Rhodococcus sp. 05-2256-B3]OZD97212.1 8-amino-7-oxononanoate synthase [Rhodococcus sp. 05-2256-B2]OZE00574.1 8-amino-7-oxononanoate synthase [Rhodococcus sp. 05-2256-B1]
MSALDWLDAAAYDRRAAGLERVVHARSPEDSTLDLASNDYLGLSRHPHVVDAACAATRRWGTGSTGSRLVTGTTTAHEQLEQDLADFVGAETGLVFSSGYTANLGVVTALADRDSVVISDAASHASLIDACRLSRARVAVARHRDVEHVEQLLRERTEPRALVVTDSIFSADGDLAPLHELYAACRRWNAVLIVDEAHGLGVRGDGGRGAVHDAGVAGLPDLVITATLSKALGSQGGVVLGPSSVRHQVLHSARSFVFDTALAPAAVGAASAALAVLRSEPDRVAAIGRRAGQLAVAAGVSPTASAVVPVVLGDAVRAVRAAGECLNLGVRVGCFRPPSVPANASRLRLTARADLSDTDIDRATSVLSTVLRAAVSG